MSTIEARLAARAPAKRGTWFDLNAMRIARRRTRRAALRLDARKPRWACLINAATLDIQSSSQCVHGQLFGRGSPVDTLETYRFIHWGFLSSPLCHSRHLTAAWKEQIAART